MNSGDAAALERAVRTCVSSVPVEIARTILSGPRATIEPRRRPSTPGIVALSSLRERGRELESKIDVHETLGVGGMGIVHLATQTALGRHVAVKTLREGQEGDDASLRMLREAWLTGMLEHPNVVPVYDVGVDASGLPLIVMKRIEGLSWRALMHDPAEIARRFAVTDALEWNLGILARVCNAVSFAHSRGIIHRDLKPENVMVGAFGEVYVLDWGVAVSLEPDPTGRLPTASTVGELVGSPAYMAPEMLLGDPALLSFATDVYLLGAILFEIVSARAPHAGGTLEEIFTAILVGQPPFPEGFPRDVRSLCETAMARMPEERYASAEAFRIAVDELARRRGSRKLAGEADRSRRELLQALEDEPAGDDRRARIWNLLGECRFGYRAALSTWSENAEAQQGLDEALGAVIEHELASGDPGTAALLLRELVTPPADLVRRVEALSRARAEEQARLRRLATDHDPNVGTRTRSFIMAMLGTLWTATPLAAYWYSGSAVVGSHLYTVVPTTAFLLFGAAIVVWARETLSKTLLNRRLTLSVIATLCAQLLLATGAWTSGLTPAQSALLLFFMWALLDGFGAIWIDRWFLAPAVVCGASFLAAARYAHLTYPLMALDNFVLTVVLVRIWLPEEAGGGAADARGAP